MVCSTAGMRAKLASWSAPSCHHRTRSESRVSTGSNSGSQVAESALKASAIEASAASRRASSESAGGRSTTPTTSTWLAAAFSAKITSSSPRSTSDSLYHTGIFTQLTATRGKSWPRSSSDIGTSSPASDQPNSPWAGPLQRRHKRDVHHAAVDEAARILHRDA